MKTRTLTKTEKQVRIINIVFTSVIGTGAILYGIKAITLYAQHNHLFGF